MMPIIDLDQKEVHIHFPSFLYRSLEDAANNFSTFVKGESNEDSRVMPRDPQKEAFYVSYKQIDQAYVIGRFPEKLHKFERFEVLDTMPTHPYDVGETVERKAIILGFKDHLDDMLKDYEAKHPELANVLKILDPSLHKESP